MKLLALKNKKKGFTLLELLVVLAILAILIAIAVPVYKGQKEKAAITAHNANVRVLETAVESYRQDHDGALPDGLDKLEPEYIKSIPKVPDAVAVKLNVKDYSINKDKKSIDPREVDKSGNLIPEKENTK